MDWMADFDRKKNVESWHVCQVPWKSEEEGRSYEVVGHGRLLPFTFFFFLVIKS